MEKGNTMHMTTKILAIGLLMGLGLGATTANAKTNPTCQTKTDWSKPCTDPANSENWTFNNSADAEAWAAAIGIGQGGAGGQGGDGGNASSDQTQGQSQSVSISAPSRVTTIGAALVIDVDVADIIDGPNKRAVRTSGAYAAIGATAKAEAVLDSTYWGKKANKLLADRPAPICYFSKEDGAVHVYPTSHTAACLAQLGL